MKNSELTAMFDQWTQTHGIHKAEGKILSLSDMNMDGLIPYTVIEQIIDMMRDQSQILSQVRTLRRQNSVGTFPILDLNEPVVEYVGENDGTKVLTTPEARQTGYSCKKFKSELYITTEELQEAAVAGFENFEGRMMSMWSKQLSNDIAAMIMNGDKTLLPTTRTNRLYRAVDGINKLTDTGGLVIDAAGTEFNESMFFAMLDSLPERYADDPGLKFLFNRRVDLNWRKKLTNISTTEKMRSALGDKALTSVDTVPPAGIQQILVNQISSYEGASGTPDAVTASAPAIILRVNALLPDTSNKAGRKVKVTHKTTGLSEVCTVTYNGSSQNIITTTSALGQTTISTTAADYIIKVYDLTSIYLCNPQLLTLIYAYQWRSYREFNKDFDRYEITTYFQADFCIPLVELVMKLKNVLVKQLSF